MSNEGNELPRGNNVGTTRSVVIRDSVSRKMDTGRKRDATTSSILQVMVCNGLLGYLVLHQ
jgi:hypothetical protein